MLPNIRHYEEMERIWFGFYAKALSLSIASNDSAAHHAGADVKSCSILSPAVKGRTLRHLKVLQNNLIIHSMAIIEWASK